MHWILLSLGVLWIHRNNLLICAIRMYSYQSDLIIRKVNKWFIFSFIHFILSMTCFAKQLLLSIEMLLDYDECVFTRSSKIDTLNVICINLLDSLWYNFLFITNALSNSIKAFESIFNIMAFNNLAIIFRKQYLKGKNLFLTGDFCT